MQTVAAPLKPRVEQVGEKVAATAIIVLVAGGLLYFLNRSSPLKFDWMTAHFGDLLEPARLTLLITVASYLCGMAIGFSLGWLRTLKVRPVRALATGWVEAIRGTPMLVQLLFLFSLFSYYNPGNLSLRDSLLLTGFLAMMINTGAYQAEIFRAGLQSVAHGQVEAAKAIGLSYWGRMRSVIMPQAFRVIIPPLTNEFILMLKASSLLAVIGIVELTYEAKVFSFTTGNFVEVYAMVTILYLIMTVPLAKLIAWLEQRYRIPGLGLQQEVRARPRRQTGSTGQTVIGIPVSRFRRRPKPPA